HCLCICERCERYCLYTAVLQRTYIGRRSRVVQLTRVGATTFALCVHDVERLAIGRNSHSGGIPSCRYVLEHLHRLNIDHGNCVNARFRHVELAVTQCEATGHDATKRPALGILESLSGERSERNLSENMLPIGANLDDRILMRQRDVNSIIRGCEPGGSGAAYHATTSLIDTRSQMQFCDVHRV